MTFFRFQMKSYFIKALPAALLLAFAVPARAGIVHQKMEDVEGHFAAIDDQVKAGTLDTSAPEHARAIQALFEELDCTPSSYSADPLWHAWLDDSAQAARRLAAALEPKTVDLSAARTELKRIADLREQAHTHFRPGLLGRIERWLMQRKTRHHETTPPAGLPHAPILGAPAGVRAP
jgi:hypothetical protein